MMDWVKNGLSKAEVRAILAVTLVASFILLSFYIAIVYPQHIQLVYSALANAMFAVLAFYFGTKTLQQHQNNHQ
ncbi:MAG: hypothetical protein QXG39_10035 [Candidatus Aenigmatarchaeota archaeon]